MLIQSARLQGINQPLVVEQTTLPSLPPGHVTVKIFFAGINFYELMLIAGRYPITADFPITIGGELSGEVMAVGEGVADFNTGDKVFSLAQTGKGTTGSYASYANIDTKYLYHLPESLSFEAGAGFPMVFFTAHTMLTRKVQVNDSAIILVHSAAGGVGGALVQFIRALYPTATIIGTYSDSKKEKILKDSGVNVLINWQAKDLVTEITDKFPAGIDIIFDPVGQSLVDAHLKLLKPLSGTWCSYGAYSGAIDDVNLVGKLRSRNGTMAGFLMWPLIENKDRCQKQFARIMKTMKKFKILPRIDKIFPLADANQALERMNKRKNIGKILLDCT